MMYAWSMMIICVLAFRSTTNLWLAWLSPYVTQYSTYNIYLGPSTTILANAINVQRHDNTKVKSPCFRCPPTACRGGWHRSTMSGCDPTLPGMDRFMNLVNYQYMVTINLQVSDFEDFFCCQILVIILYWINFPCKSTLPCNIVIVEGLSFCVNNRQFLFPSILNSTMSWTRY